MINPKKKVGSAAIGGLAHYLSITVLSILTLGFIVFVLVRDLNYPDDENYSRIYSEVIGDFFGASEKYGFIYKIFIYLINFFPGGGVNLAFSLVILLLYLFILINNTNRKNILFLSIIFSMPIIWFVQMRQGLAMAFLVGAITSRSTLSKSAHLAMATFSHFSVAPFGLWFILYRIIMPKALMSIRMLIFTGLVFAASFTFVVNNVGLIAETTGYPLNVLIQVDSMRDGNLGIGTTLLFFFLLTLSFYSKKSEKSIHLSIGVWGVVIIFLSLFAPLMQRLLAAFILYLIVSIVIDKNINIKLVAFIFIISLSFGLIKMAPFLVV